MLHNPTLILAPKQTEWLNALVECKKRSLIPPIPSEDWRQMVQTLYIGWYYNAERTMLNHYLRKYPLSLLRKLIRERK